MFDFSRIAKALSEVCVAENAWMATFQTLALSPIEVYYEDLVETPTDRICELLKKMGIVAESSFTIEPKIYRQGDDLNLDFRNRFIERLSA